MLITLRKCFFVSSLLNTKQVERNVKSDIAQIVAKIKSSEDNFFVANDTEM